MDSILKFLDSSFNQTPVAYGWFHLTFFAIAIIVAVFLSIKFRNSTEKQNKAILLTISIICFVLEIYKQINFSYNHGNWTYQWYAFPFQLCSTPFYVAFIAAFLKPSKFREYLYSFLGLYALFAGIGVMIVPGDVFTPTIGIDIQTMVHHGSQVVLGVYLLSSGRAKVSYKTLLKGSAVFSVLVGIALILNIIAHQFVSGTFNMFFIGPYTPCHLPLLSQLYSILTNPMLLYPLFLISYIVILSIGAGAVLVLAFIIKALIIFIKSKIFRKDKNKILIEEKVVEKK